MEEIDVATTAVYFFSDKQKVVLHLSSHQSFSYTGEMRNWEVIGVEKKAGRVFYLKFVLVKCLYWFDQTQSIEFEVLPSSSY